MSRYRFSISWLLAGIATLAAAMLLLFIVFGTTEASAQSTGGSGSITNGPGGVWVLRGNHIFICDVDPVLPNTTGPPKPRCGPPALVR